MEQLGDGGAWLVETLWDHYDYTRDTEYLPNTAYPLMKGAADFLLEWLIPNPYNPNELITAPLHIARGRLYHR